MVRPRRFLRALVPRTGPTTTGVALCAALVLPLGLGAGLAPAGASGAPATGPASRSSNAAAARGARAVPIEPDTAPLRVRIETMSRAALPARGTVTIRGTVTNRSEETWTTIRLYTVNGTESADGTPMAPMTGSDDLAAAMDVAYDAEVGQRLVSVGEPGAIETLGPGETASYVVRVPAEEITPGPDEVPADGVYWFGVHALGQGGALPRDELADGRARTFLPYVPRDTAPVPTALVVPLTQNLLYDSDGSLSDEDRWERLLSPGGRLHDLLTLGRTGAAADVPISWLVDPALIDAVARLAAGNSPRSLEPTPTTAQSAEEPADPAEPAEPAASPTAGADPSPETSAEPSPQPSPGTDPGGGQEPADPPEPETPLGAAAREWLTTAGEVFGSGDVVTLPYGNPDVAATQQAEPGLLALALAQESPALSSLGVEATSVLAAPDGYVDAALAAAAPEATPILVNDRYLRVPVPGVARLDGRQLIVTSSGAAEGSPGPGRSVTAVGLRQRVLAEAAVRALPDPTDPDPTDPDPTDADPDPSATFPSDDPTTAVSEEVTGSVSGQPLVVMLPTDWNLETAAEFFDGLERTWVNFVPLGAVATASPGRDISTDDLTELPGADGEQRRGLEPETIQAVQDLIATGDTLQRVLVANTRVGARVTEQALSGLSYASPSRQRVERGSLALSRGWLDDVLGQVQITASSGVTLSGDTGSFQVTLRNDLDEAVIVGLGVVSDEGIIIDPVEPLRLGAKSRSSVLLNVTTTTSRVHNVSLMVTDVDGTPLGATDQLPIRSALVSDVIWVIIGVGVGTLLLAIGLRLRRRILAARRGDEA